MPTLNTDLHVTNCRPITHSIRKLYTLYLKHPARTSGSFFMTIQTKAGDIEWKCAPEYPAHLAETVNLSIIKAEYTNSELNLLQRISMAGSGGIVIKNLGSAGGARPGVRIPGVFPSVRFGEQQVSTGIPSLDASIGGGIPLGSILLIEESVMTNYADMILKCYLAEGSYYKHHLYVAGCRSTPQKLIAELPSLKSDAGADPDDSKNPIPRNLEGDMKIAWRYQHESSPIRKSTLSQTKQSKFEFKTKSTPEDLGGPRVGVIVSNLFQELSLIAPVNVDNLLKEIGSGLREFKYGSKNLMRIGLSHCEEYLMSPNFMNGLRALVRHTNSSAVLTVSSHSLSQKFLKRCEQLSDTVIKLHLILDEHKRAELGNVDGVCKITKLSSINSLKIVESSRELAFRFHRRQLHFQELHLPPEGETTAQREVSASSVHKTATLSSCGTVKGKLIDF